MPICACNKAKKIVEPNTNNSDYNVDDDEQVEVSSSSFSHSHALVNVNNTTPTLKTQRYGKGEEVIQFMKQLPMLILQEMKVKVVANQDTPTPRQRLV